MTHEEIALGRFHDWKLLKDGGVDILFNADFTQRFPYLREVKVENITPLLILMNAAEFIIEECDNHEHYTAANAENLGNS